MVGDGWVGVLNSELEDPFCFFFGGGGGGGCRAECDWKISIALYSILVSQR